MGAAYDKAKGRIKEAAGDATGNRSLRREGRIDQAAAEVKAKTNRAVDKVRDALNRRRAPRGRAAAPLRRAPDLHGDLVTSSVHDHRPEGEAHQEQATEAVEQVDVALELLAVAHEDGHRDDGEEAVELVERWGRLCPGPTP